MTESESKILGTGWSLVILVIVMYPTSQHYGIQGPSIGFQLRNMTVPQLGNKTKAENKNKTKQKLCKQMPPLNVGLSPDQTGKKIILDVWKAVRTNWGPSLNPSGP